MKSFAIARPGSHAAAAKLAADKTYTLPVIKSGGIDIIDQMKEGLLEPDLLVHLGSIGEGAATISMEGGRLRIGAGVTLAQIASSPIVIEHCPVLAQTAASAATPAVRNMATIAGNLLQRPRCWYFRQHQFDCLKKGGGTCYAVEGENKYHAIFGGGPCHIVHPSNLAPALVVAGGVAHLVGGKRTSIPIADLFHTPDKGVRTEHVLEPGEVLTHLTCDAAPASGFCGIKEKQSFDWPLAFACVGLRVTDGTIQSAGVCAGAVAPVPWSLPRVAEALAGVKVGDDAAIRAAAVLSGQDARPMRDNGYKVRLLGVAVHRAALKALGREAEGLS